MARIQFRAKTEKVYNMEGALAYERIKVPRFTRAHCDMAAFRVHPKYGPYANSDMFSGMLSKIRRGMLGSEYREHMRLDQVPAGVTVDMSGFLALVSYEA